MKTTYKFNKHQMTTMDGTGLSTFEKHGYTIELPEYEIVVFITKDGTQYKAYEASTGFIIGYTGSYGFDSSLTRNRNGAMEGVLNTLKGKSKEEIRNAIAAVKTKREQLEAEAA